MFARLVVLKTQSKKDLKYFQVFTAQSILIFVSSLTFLVAQPSPHMWSVVSDMIASVLIYP